MLENDELKKTVEILEKLPGGPELLAWFGGSLNFGDGEVVSLTLDRGQFSVLRVLAMRRDANGDFSRAMISFHLAGMIDVAIEGFSHQNVIDNLKLRPAPDNEIHPSLLGIGLIAPEFEIQLNPCAGAFGIIRASIVNISIEPVQP
jgi:hypothetical protein